jgi:glycosyltransferase involved in cell wall biosynthesis
MVTVVAPAPPEDSDATHLLHGAEVLRVSHDARLSLLRDMRPWRVAAGRVIDALEADVIHGQGILIGGVVAADVSPRPRLVTARGNQRRDTLAAYPGARGRLRAALGDRIVRRVVRSVDLVVDVHPDWRVNLPLEPSRLAYIPNIVDAAFFAAVRSPVEHTVLYCGGTRRIKGWDILERAWWEVNRALPDARLRVVGWPEEAPPPDLPNVVVRSALSAEQLAEEMAAAELVVIPSRYEVAPIVLAEAWAAGTPAVATSAGGMASLAPAAALVVPPESPGPLARAVIDILSGAVDTSTFVECGRGPGAPHPAAQGGAAPQ